MTAAHEEQLRRSLLTEIKSRAAGGDQDAENAASFLKSHRHTFARVPASASGEREEGGRAQSLP